MSDPKCSICSATNDVAYYSPDMDITHVPLCILCWWRVVGGDYGREQLGVETKTQAKRKNGEL